MPKQTKKIEGGSEYYTYKTTNKSGRLKHFEATYIMDMVDPAYQIGARLPGGFYKDAIRTREEVKTFNKKLAQNRVDMLRLEGVHFKTWEDRNSSNNGTKLNP